MSLSFTWTAAIFTATDLPTPPPPRRRHQVAGAIESHGYARVNPSVKILGVLVNKAQRHLRLWSATHRRLEADALRALPVEIPRSVRVAEGRP